jgi:hypothetical protein
MVIVAQFWVARFKDGYSATNLKFAGEDSLINTQVENVGKQDGLTKREEDERSEDNVWITMQQKVGGQMEGHEWVIEEK